MDSDPEIEFVEKDSGMSSLGGSTDETPERRTVATTSHMVDETQNYDDEPDETLAERLWGLTEMFPEPVRKVSGKVTDMTISSIKGLYSFSCSASWIFFTSSVVLFAPVIFETERAQMQEVQNKAQKQVLLGPASVMAGGGGTPALPLMR